MKLHKYITAVCIVVASTSLLGCSDDLAITPTDNITADQAFEKLADLQSGLIGVYAGLDNQDIGLSTKWSDENYYPRENNSNVGGPGYRWEIDPDTGDAAVNWTPLYNVIYRINRILAVIDNIPVNGATEQASKDRIKGELLAIRAHAHLQLLRSYAESYSPTALGIPYLKSFDNDPTVTKPARPTVASNFADIEADLANAKQLIPPSIADVTRITQTAVSAIQARLYLYEKQWDKAIAATTEVINAVPLASRTQFAGIWTDANNSDIVWKLKRESGNTAIGSTYRNTQGLVYFAASVKLINTFDKTNDIRFASYIKIDENRSVTQTKNLVVKYVGGNSALLNIADLKLYRAAEAYFIRAEAYAEKSLFAQAVSDINTVRRSRIGGYADIVAYANKDLAIDDIYYERFKELAFEGHRYFDLRRQGKVIDRNPIASDDNSGGSLILQASQKQYYLPIPGTEIRANGNIVQNPIYVE